jgi:hypothetical protein
MVHTSSKTINVSDPSKNNIMLSKNQKVDIESENKITFTPKNNKIKTLSIKSKNRDKSKNKNKNKLKTTQKPKSMSKSSQGSKFKLQQEQKSKKTPKKKFRSKIRAKYKSKNKYKIRHINESHSINFNLENNEIKEYYNSSYRGNTQSSQNDYRETTNLNTSKQFEIEEMPEIDTNTLFD